ncbi:MAG: hypothetical protein JWP82_2393 [Humibacillus sp.]|nr:hypothetical protein [Humibacillus sp.]
MTTPLETRFETPGPVQLVVDVPQGDITVRTTAAVDGGAATTVRLVPRGKAGRDLAERFAVESRGNAVVVMAPKERGFSFGRRDAVDVEVDVPEGSSLDLRTGSGDIVGTGRYETTKAATGSGDVTLEDVGTADLKSGSGDLRARSVHGTLKAKTGSGDVVLEATHGEADIVSGSGDITLRRAEAEVRAKSGSGDVTIGASVADLDVLTGTGDLTFGAVHGGQVQARTGTGDVTIGVVSGVAALLDLNTVTGDVRIDLEETEGPGDAEGRARLSVQSGSGDIKVRRAQASLA